MELGETARRSEVVKIEDGERSRNNQLINTYHAWICMHFSKEMERCPVR